MAVAGNSTGNLQENMSQGITHLPISIIYIGPATHISYYLINMIYIYELKYKPAS